jgi:hypothetical protein
MGHTSIAAAAALAKSPRKFHGILLEQVSQACEPFDEVH